MITKILPNVRHKAYIKHKTIENTLKITQKYEDQPDFMVKFGKAYITFFMKKPQYFHFLFGQGIMEGDFSSEAGEVYKPFQIYKEQVLKRLEHTDLTREKKQDCVLSLFAYVHGLTALATMPNVKYDLGWENKMEDLITTLCLSL